MNHLKALVLMQLKDKIDLGFVRTKKSLIRKIVFTILKFVGVAAASFLVWYLLVLMMFDVSDTPRVMIVVLTLLLTLSLITSTVGLVKALYFAEDNRVLITFPVGNNVIFLSKIIVFYFYELAREYFFILPILLGMGLYSVSLLTPWFFPWVMILMLFVPMLPVLIGATISIPTLFFARFCNRFPVIKILFFVCFTGLIVWGLVKVIGLIPENLNLVTQGASIISAAKDFLVSFERAVLPIASLVALMTGVRLPNNVYTIFHIRTLSYLGIFFGVVLLFFALVFFLSRPLFFKMMSKSFEYIKKSSDGLKLNKKRTRWRAFTYKEFKLCVMNVEVSLSFLVVYIAVPVMIFLLNKLYSAMDTRLKGDVMTYAFNIMIMLLPMLASNSVIATLFSKEGRAGYLKKTEPVNIVSPLVAKLIFFIIASVPSVIATVLVFSQFTEDVFKWYDIILLACMILAVQYGHMFFSALLDIMRPQNEQYATVGSSAKNPNENTSTLVAFFLSAFFALFSFILFGEETMSTRSVTGSMIKLTCIAVAVLVSSVTLFVKCVKAYYYEK